MNLPEFGNRVRRGGVSLVLAGMLMASAACGGGGETTDTASPAAGESPAAVSGEVTVTEEVAVEETPAAAATPERKAPVVHTAQLTRDPFQNPTAGLAAPASAPAAPTQTAATPARPATPSGGGGTAAPAAVAKPDIRVTGIVRSGGTYRAILTGPESSYIVAAGEKLGAYTITSISATAVTIQVSGTKFTLPLEQESFGPAGSSPAGAGPGGAGAGPGPGPGGPPPGPGGPPPGPGGPPPGPGGPPPGQ